MVERSPKPIAIQSTAEFEIKRVQTSESYSNMMNEAKLFLVEFCSTTLRNEIDTNTTFRDRL